MEIFIRVFIYAFAQCNLFRFSESENLDIVIK